MNGKSLFKTIVPYFLPMVLLGGLETGWSQTLPTTLDASKMTYNQISTTMKLYVFPAKKQSEAQQKTDEIECYNWAVKQSGVDPLNPPKVVAAPEQTGPTGGGAVGAAKGAAAGAAIGAIGGDAGEGAAIGAIVGGLSGRRQAKAAQAQANQNSKAAAANMEKELINSFIKGFTACLEGKGYTIK